MMSLIQAAGMYSSGVLNGFNYSQPLASEEGLLTDTKYSA